MNKKILISLTIGLFFAGIDLRAMRQQKRFGKPQLREEQQHILIRSKFAQIQNSVGLSSSPAEMKPRQVTGMQGTQGEFNYVRVGLNGLLDKPTLSGTDIQTINAKINELKGLNPGRWPRPDDYIAVLNAKLKQHKGKEESEGAATATASAKRPPYSRPGPRLKPFPKPSAATASAASAVESPLEEEPGSPTAGVRVALANSALIEDAIYLLEKLVNLEDDQTVVVNEKIVGEITLRDAQEINEMAKKLYSMAVNKQFPETAVAQDSVELRLGKTLKYLKLLENEKRINEIDSTSVNQFHEYLKSLIPE